jgi:hypothetical protein
VAPQALTLLNGIEAQECADALAAVVEDRKPSRAETVDRLFRRTLQRRPTDAERNRCVKLLEELSTAELAHALLNLNEFAFRE